MRTFRPRLWLWTFRAIPLIVGGAWLFALFCPNAFKSEAPFDPLKLDFDIGTLLLWTALVFFLGPYLLMVFVILPAFLLADHWRFKNVVAYLWFAILTAGFGPYLWYLFRVDPILCRIVDHKVRLGGETCEKLCQSV
jgi:hypothetical protein